MKAQLFVVRDCPNQAPAAVLFRRALDAAGRPDTVVETVVVTTERDAARFGFAGSPSYFVDGRDLFSGRPTGLACRVYPTSTGLRGVPDASAVVEALRAMTR